MIYDQSTTSRLRSSEFKYVKQEAQWDGWCSWILHLSMFQLVYVWHLYFPVLIEFRVEHFQVVKQLCQ